MTCEGNDLPFRAEGAFPIAFPTTDPLLEEIGREVTGAAAAAAVDPVAPVVVRQTVVVNQTVVIRSGLADLAEAWLMTGLLARRARRSSRDSSRRT